MHGRACGLECQASGEKVRFSEFVELLKQSPAKVVERITQGAIKDDMTDGADEGNPEVQKIVGHTLDMVDNYLAKLGGRLVKEAQKMDENLDNYIQYLLAKVAEADKPLSAIDLEKEERRRDYRRLRTEFCVPEARLQQKYVQRQATTYRRELYDVFGLHGYTKRDDGYHYHQ